MGDLYWLKRPIAHRGLHDAASGILENSASSVKAAIGKSYAIEVDLQCAKHGEPVVFHDFKLDRLTNESGPVADWDAESLRNVVLKGSDDRILSLADLLYIVRGFVPIVLEIKSTLTRDGTFESKIAKELSTYSGPVAVMSFDPYAVAAFRRISPKLPRGLVAARFDDPRSQQALTSRQRFVMRHLLTSTFARPHFIAYDIRGLPAIAPLAAKAIFGLPLLTWTVKTERERERAQRYADAIIFEGIDP